jgi:hypothetical protein
MYKVINLDIDGTLTGDTRVEEIALVELPAVEQNFIYFAKEKSFIVPQNVANNACRARKFKDEKGSSCGTNVGWTRSSQLCDRKPISLDTVKRMYSYFSRHAVDLESSKSYEDGCGLLMWDAWGGSEGKDWSERILQREMEMGYDITGLPEYVNYPTGDTKDNMLVEPIAFIEKIPYERKDDYIQRCVDWHIKNKGWDSDQSYAVCISQANEAFAIGDKVSFDYDETLTTPRGRGLALHELQSGSDVYIISAGGFKERMLPLAKELGIPASKVFATGSNRAKIQKIRDLKITKHYDNNNDVIDELEKIGIKGIDFMCGCLDEFAEVGERGGINPSKKAPKSDTPNPNPKGVGTAKGDAGTTRGAKVSERVEKILKDKSDDFNERYKDKLGYGVNIGMLKSVYQRGVGAYNVSHSPRVQSAEQWALARVNAFLYLVKNGRPQNPKYKGDYDLLPKEHPKYSTEKMSGDFEMVNLDIFGFKPRYFDLCPGAIETFNHLITMNVDEDTIGMIRSAAQIADNVFRIEKEVLEEGYSTQDQLDEAILLVDDFKDLMEEIDEITGMVHNVDYMDGHIRVISSYLNRQEDFTYVDIQGCRCVSHTDEDGNAVYVPCETEPVEEQSFGVEDYTEEEKEAARLLFHLKETDYEKFEAVIGAMRGATEAELRRRNHRSPTIYFKYERILTGAPDRDFCTSIENRYFRRLEIDLLRDTNTEFGHERQPYSKWLYKGGPNCVHAWRKYLVQGDVIADQGMAEGKAGMPPKSMPNNGYYSPETKRKSEVAYIISQQNMSKQFFADKNEEKRMLYGPLMIPNILIPRIDEVTNEKYFVKFTPESIEKMQQLYMIEKRMDKTNYEHSNKKVPSVVMVESWIVSGENDKAYELGFEKDNISKGTWMGGFKVMDTPEGDYIWNEFIKTGKVKGFSVEGEFLLKFHRQNYDEYLLNEIINIINKINE